MADFYGSVAGVLTRTNIQPRDLNFGDESNPDDALRSFVEDLLAQAADLMDRVMRKSYLTDDDPPAGLRGIADDAVADSLRTMVQTRQTPVVRVDDYAVKVVTSMLLTKDMLGRLRYYSKGGGLGSIDVGQDSIRGLPTSLTAAQLNTVDFPA